MSRAHSPEELGLMVIRPVQYMQRGGWAAGWPQHDRTPMTGRGVLGDRSWGHGVMRMDGALIPQSIFEHEGLGLDSDKRPGCWRGQMPPRPYTQGGLEVPVS